MSINEAFAQPLEFQHKDKVYHCSLVTQNIKLQFEKRLFARAKDAAIGMREAFTKEEYLQHIGDLNSKYLRGDYAFESEIGLDACKTITGLKLLVSLLFNISEEEAVGLAIECKEEMMQVVTMAIQQSFPGMKQVSEESKDEPVKKKD